MAQSVRVEFVTLGKGEGGKPENVVVGLLDTPAPATLSVSNTATSSGARPQVPTDAAWGGAVRLTAITNAVYVAWGADPTASLTNSLRLVPDSSEILFIPDGSKLSFIAENA